MFSPLGRRFLPVSEKLQAVREYGSGGLYAHHRCHSPFPVGQLQTTGGAGQSFQLTLEYKEIQSLSHCELISDEAVRMLSNNDQIRVRQGL